MNENEINGIRQMPDDSAANPAYEQLQPNYANSNRTPIVANALPSSKNNMAVGSLVCGIISILAFWSSYPGLICGIVGLVMGIIYLAKKGEKKGLGIAGIITSVIGILLSLIVCGLVLLALSLS